MRSFPPWLLTAVLLLGGTVLQAAEGPARSGLVKIPAGTFKPFYAPEEGPPIIRVEEFQLAARPVTVANYLKFVQANPVWRKSWVNRVLADESYLRNWTSDFDPGTNTPSDGPVTSVSWYAARAYAEWSGQRLPRTMEWEYAASAGFSRVDGQNDSEFKQQVLRWYTTPNPARLPEVGGRTNAFGIQDLHGLVWEWTEDFAALASGDSRASAAPDRDRFCGAGSQGARDPSDFPAFMRYGFRSSLKPNYCVHNLGFRCAADSAKRK